LSDQHRQIKDVIIGLSSNPSPSLRGMGEVVVSAAASEVVSGPSWAGVVSALGAVVAALAAVATVIVAVIAAALVLLHHVHGRTT
jgi:hypothetical protein